MFKRFVDAIEVLAGMAAVLTAVLLLTVSPTVSQDDTPDLGEGAEIFRSSCAGCHGASGDGGVGPSLAAGLSRFDTSEEVAGFVSTGVPGRMPGFETRLTPDQINAVAEHVWVNLAGR